MRILAPQYYFFGRLLCVLSCRSNEKEVLRIIASQYLAVLILGFANSATIQSVIAIERPVMYRERAAGERSSVFWTGSWCLMAGL